MIRNEKRNGNFTNSEIIALTSSGTKKGSLGKPAFTYINECNIERRLGRSISTESNARPLTWGSANEKRVFELLGTEYKLCSEETIMHPTIDFWAGSPDAEKFDEGKTIVDIKCPITLKSFATLVQPIYDGLKGIEAMNWIRDNHKDGDKFFWQIVSNAVLTGAEHGELIVYCPYLSELESIRDMVSMMDDAKQYRFKWIAFADLDELPYLPDGGYYKNLNVIRFPISKEYKDFITERVLLGGEHLIEIP